MRRQTGPINILLVSDQEYNYDKMLLTTLTKQMTMIVDSGYIALTDYFMDVIITYVCLLIKDMETWKS